MNTKDIQSKDRFISRWNALRDALAGNESTLKLLSDTFDLRLASFDEHSRPITIKDISTLPRAEGTNTDIASALKVVLGSLKGSANTSQRASSSILLISDGRETTPGDVIEEARLAKKLSIPIHTICLGKNGTSPAEEFSVQALRTRVFATPGQVLSLPVQLRFRGIGNPTVQLFLEVDGRVAAAQKLSVSNGEMELQLPIPAQRPGFHHCEIILSAISGNNHFKIRSSPVFLTTLFHPINALLIDGNPDWDTKFLANTLRSDPGLNLDTIIQLTDSVPFALSGSESGAELRVPATLQEFSRYDLIILGSRCESLLNQTSQIALKQWTADRGGSLMFIRGDPVEGKNSLDGLLPILADDHLSVPVRFEVTNEGFNRPSFGWISMVERADDVPKLPMLLSRSNHSHLTNTASLLAEGLPFAGAQASIPLIAEQRVGNGWVWELNGSGIWRWALQPDDNSFSSRVYSKLWLATVRTLLESGEFMPQQELDVRTDKLQYSIREKVHLHISMRLGSVGSAPSLRVLGSSGVLSPLRNVFNAREQIVEYTAGHSGKYQLQKSAPSGSFETISDWTVSDTSSEETDTVPNQSLMAELADLSGGSKIRLDQIGSLASLQAGLFPAVKSMSEPQSIWDNGFILLLLFSLLGVEWALRRRSG